MRSGQPAWAASPEPYQPNVERAIGIGYGHGQISVAFLAARCRDGAMPVGGAAAVREDAGAVTAADVLQVVDVVAAWLDPASPCALGVTRQCLRCLAVISDAFADLGLHRRVVDLIAGLARAELADDSPLLRHALPALCKSYAVVIAAASIAVTASPTAVAAAAPHTDIVVRLVLVGLQSVCASNQVAALHGILLLLQARADDAVALLLPALAAAIPAALAQATGPEHLACLVAVACAVVELYPNQADGLGLGSRSVLAAVQLAQLPSCPDAVFAAVLQGLDRLLLCFALQRAEQHAVASLARLAPTMSIRSRRGALVLGLLVTCMYSGRDAARPSGLLGSLAADAANANEAMDTVAIETMERIAALFNCIRVGGAAEAHLLENLLPPLLDDFLPPRQVMNIVMGEFSSTQQPHPELVATIVHRVWQEGRTPRIPTT